MSIRLQNNIGSEIDHRRPKNHLNTISTLLEQLQTKNNQGLIKEIWYLIEDLQSAQMNQIHKLSKQLKKGNSFYLSIKQIQKLLSTLAHSFAQVLQKIPDRRIQSIYSQILHIAFKLKNIEPTSIHTHSTRMKQHLLDELKDQKKKRYDLQRDFMVLSQQFQRVSNTSKNMLDEKENVNTQQYQKIEHKFVELSREMTLLKQNNSKLKSSNQELKRERNELLQQIKYPCEVCKTKDFTIKQLSNKLKVSALQLNSAIQDKSKSNQNQGSLKNQIDALQEQVEELQKIRLSRQNLITELEQDLNHANLRLDQATVNDSNIKFQNEELKRQLQDLNSRLRKEAQQLGKVRIQLQNLNEQFGESRRLQKQLEIERQNFLLKTDELQNKIQELQTQLNELLQVQDNSKAEIKKLNKQVQQKDKNANIHASTAERLRKQLNQLKKRQEEAIQQKSDESDDGIIKISSMQKGYKSGRLSYANQKKSLFSTPNKLDEIQQLQQGHKRSNPQIEIVEDELLRMLLSQALSLQSFIEKD